MNCVIFFIFPLFICATYAKISVEFDDGQTCEVKNFKITGDWKITQVIGRKQTVKICMANSEPGKTLLTKFIEKRVNVTHMEIIEKAKITSIKGLGPPTVKANCVTFGYTEKSTLNKKSPIKTALPFTQLSGELNKSLGTNLGLLNTVDVTFMESRATVEGNFDEKAKRLTMCAQNKSAFDKRFSEIEEYTTLLKDDVELKSYTTFSFMLITSKIPRYSRLLIGVSVISKNVEKLSIDLSFDGTLEFKKEPTYVEKNFMWVILSDGSKIAGAVDLSLEKIEIRRYYYPDIICNKQTIESIYSKISEMAEKRLQLHPELDDSLAEWYTFESSTKDEKEPTITILGVKK